jgi:hypothetical protein
MMMAGMTQAKPNEMSRWIEPEMNIEPNATQRRRVGET